MSRSRARKLLLLAGLITFGFVLVVQHRFFQMELVHAQIDLVAISHALDEFANEHSEQYPIDLSSLVTADGEGRTWLEGFNGHPPNDPWGHEYRYEPPTPQHPWPRVLSLGADGKLGGTGEDADIDSDQLRESDR